MKNIYFSQLKENDTVWIVYNNVNGLAMTEGKILKNDLEKKEISYSDHYDNNDTNIIYEYNISIIVDEFNCIYTRCYGEYYNKKGQMSFTSPCKIDQYDTPNIEVFTSKKFAKKYVINFINKLIYIANNTINKNKVDLKKYKKCLNEIKNT